jgi:predicted HTH transcriptional regulator
MTKMTYVDALNYVLNMDILDNDNDEVREKLEALKSQLMKRASGVRKPTKTQVENESLKENIFAYVSENGAKRASEVAAYFNLSGQKASALLKQLVDAQALERFTEKRVTYFRVAEGE